MAHTLCICGNYLSNVSCPSDVEYSVFSHQEVLDALAVDPDMRFIDFRTGWDELHECKRDFCLPYSYWYCHKCNRMMVYDDSIKDETSLIKRYIKKRTPYFVDEKFLNKCSRIYVCSDIEEEDICNKHGEVSLKWMKENWHPKYDYYISPNQKTVVVCDHGTKNIEFVYVSEVIDLSKYKA